MTTTALRTTASFAQLKVCLGNESVDVVADPTPIAEAAQPFVVGPHQLLVNKLCALLSRSRPVPGLIEWERF